MNLLISNRFKKNLEGFKERKILKKVEKTMNLLVKDPFYPSLRLHKLKNRGPDYSVSVDMSIRIILRIEGDNILLLNIGTHDEVY